MPEYRPDELLHGGESIQVQLRSGGACGIFVRQITPRELTAYLQAEMGGDEAVIAMTCRQLDGAPVPLDDLTLEAFESLLEADARQNFTAARAKEKRDIARAGRQIAALRDANPDAYKELQSAQSAALGSLISSLEPSPPALAAGASASK